MSEEATATETTEVNTAETIPPLAPPDLTEAVPELAEMPNVELKPQRLSMGRIVHYRLTERDCEELNPLAPGGKGNTHYTGQAVPAIVVQVWSDTCCNLRVLSDGAGVLWRTSSVLGDGHGQWQWPVRG